MQPSDDADEAALVTLLADVAARPWAHDFFALLRRVDALQPQRPRTGHALRPSQERLRLGQACDLDFAPAALAGLRQPPRAAAPWLAVRFLGLTGPQGALPLHLTELLRERGRHGDAAPLRFLDVFHHRTLSFFHRAWADAQPLVQRDRPDDDRFRRWLGALAGLPAPEPSRALADDGLVFQAGLLSARSRHAEGLAKVLRQQLGVPVRLQTLVGRWQTIEPDDRGRLAVAATRPERLRMPGARLGQDAHVGRKVWDHASHVRLRIGPLAPRRLWTMLPGGDGWRRLGAWMPRLVGQGLRWDVQFEIDVAQRTAVPLGPPRAQRAPLPASSGQGGPQTPRRRPSVAANDVAVGPALGLTSWLGRRAPPPGARCRPGPCLRPGLSFVERRATALPG